MERNLTIDNLRGIAFLLMIFQHLFYFYDVSTNYATEYRNINIVDYSGTIARNLFILLAGYSVYMTYKKDNKIHVEKRIKRSIEILQHALLITAVTYFLYPDKFIQFGILHFLALGTFLISFAAPNKLIAALLAMLVSLPISYPITGTFLDTILGSNINNLMMDYFPINKWLPVLFTGLVIGQNIDLNIPGLQFNNIITDIGQNSLNLYTYHLIILLVVFKFV
jgi:uncharacterized membrane protein